MSERWLKVFPRFQKQARKIVQDRRKVAFTVGEAYKKAYQHRGALTAIWDDLQTLMRLARCWVGGEYRRISRFTLATVVGALAYLVCPIDAVVDAVPVLGLLDDAAVIGFAVRRLRTELEAFRTWERGRQPSSDRELAAVTES